MSKPEMPELAISVTHADTFHENDAAVDEEIGASDRFHENSAPRGNSSNGGSSSDAPPAPKSRTGWIAAGAVGLLVVIVVAVAMSNNGKGDDAQVSAVAAPSAPDVTLAAPAVPDDGGGYVVDDGPAADASEGLPSAESPVLSSDDVGDNGGEDVAQFDPQASVGDDGAKDVTQFDPQVNVGDAAVLALPEVVAATTSPTKSPSDSPTDEPTAKASIMPSTSFAPTKSPTVSPSAEPTPSPSGSPSKKPTDSPSTSPTDEPTDAPTESPSNPPSGTPTKSPFSFSSWTFAAFGLEPTAAPTEEPTRNPTKQPTKRPTRNPTKRPTPAPTNEPTPGPTNRPSDQPTKQPTRQPSNNPTKHPTSEPTREPTRKPSRRPTDSPSEGPTTSAPTPYEPFFFGDEFVSFDDLGIDVSEGLSVRVIAEVGQSVPYANGGASKLRYHEDTDAAGIVPMNPDDPTSDGYVYVVNAEKGDGEGGVYGIYFDKDGNVLEYTDLLTGTTDNCGGGHTPWNTWVSCEEYEDGQCWEVDPVNGRARETRLGGRGGRYESVACDDSEPSRPVFFTTEDDETGALRRFAARGAGWGALHSDGDESFLLIKDGRNFEWTADESAARRSAARYYRNSEGIQYHEGRLYFMAKKDRKMIILDLDEMTYETEITGKKFYGEGSFGAQPDQNVFGPTRKYIYFTEDGGSSPGVYARFGEEGTFFTMFQAISGGVWDGDETVGIALSPDNKRFYAGIQLGIIFEFTRDDGLPFE